MDDCRGQGQQGSNIAQLTDMLGLARKVLALLKRNCVGPQFSQFLLGKNRLIKMNMVNSYQAKQRKISLLKKRGYSFTIL